MRVHQLMDRTWYRKPDHRIGSLTWGFQAGHTLPYPGREERWIDAASEVLAMDRLLQELEDAGIAPTLEARTSSDLGQSHRRGETDR